jgi:hypothetical protein
MTRSLRARLRRLESRRSDQRCPRCSGRAPVLMLGGAWYGDSRSAPETPPAPCPGCGWSPAVLQVVGDRDCYGKSARLEGTGHVRAPQAP